jgi:3-methylcrotonyl-CoA carboxylase alpha subunit
MTTFSFRADDGPHRHTARRGPPASVDGTDQAVRALGDGRFVVDVDGRPVQVLAAAHGDTVHLQLRGRSAVIERVDPTRSGTGAGAGGGDAAAPMPGVVVSWVAQPGAQVKAGDALLVIESMKLQVTIEAPRDGLLESLPFAPGQSFQRGAVLAHLRAAEAAE